MNDSFSQERVRLLEAYQEYEQDLMAVLSYQKTIALLRARQSQILESDLCQKMDNIRVVRLPDSLFNTDDDKIRLDLMKIIVKVKRLIRELRAKKMKAELGFSIDELLDQNMFNPSVPGICTSCNTVYESGFEPDQDKGYCENCGHNKVKSLYEIF